VDGILGEVAKGMAVVSSQWSTISGQWETLLAV